MRVKREGGGERETRRRDKKKTYSVNFIHFLLSIISLSLDPVTILDISSERKAEQREKEGNRNQILEDFVDNSIGGGIAIPFFFVVVQ